MSFRSSNIYHRTNKKSIVMIQITITDGRVRIEGHAGYAPIGYDIVCAGVSALADTLVMSFCELTKSIITVNDDYGLMEIEVESPTEAGMLLMDSFVIGISAIADDYPDNVSVRDDRSRRETITIE